mgnify:FL=1
MNPIDMSDDQLMEAVMDFDVAVEIILRGNFPRNFIDKAWEVYHYEMLREEELLRQQEAQMEAA